MLGCRLLRLLLLAASAFIPLILGRHSENRLSLARNYRIPLDSVIARIGYLLFLQTIGRIDTGRNKWSEYGCDPKRHGNVTGKSICRLEILRAHQDHFVSRDKIA